MSCPKSQGEEASKEAGDNKRMLPSTAKGRNTEHSGVSQDEVEEQQPQQHKPAASIVHEDAHETPDADREGEMECWICRSGGITAQNPLVTSVCKCRGSVGWVHRECIDAWVFSRRRASCPSCGATYNILAISDVSLPQTFFEQLCFFLWDLILPLSAKALVLLLGIALNGFVVPCIIGVTFYYKCFFVSNGDDAPKPSEHSSNSSETIFLQTPEEGASKFPDVWLWINVMVYGWICVTLWRFTKTGWCQWRAFFEDTDAVFATAMEELQEEEEEEENEEEEDEDEDEEDDDDEEEGPRLQPNTVVGTLHWILDWSLERTGSSQKMLRPRILELGTLVPLSFIVNFSLGKVLLCLILVLGLVLRRFLYPRKRINDPTRRFEEAQERKTSATKTDIVLWFITYLTELVLFSIPMTTCGGIVVHFAVSPYFLTFPASLSAFADELTITRLLAYWLVGSFCSMILLHVETAIIVPLFAPGVELYFVRSVDLNLEDDTVYWKFVLAQVFDTDPLGVSIDFIRFCCIEMSLLYAFLATPLYVMFAAHEVMMGDGANSTLTPTLASGFPVVMVTPAVDGIRAWLEPYLVPEKILLSESYYQFFFSLMELLVSFFARFLMGVILWFTRNPYWLRCVANTLIVFGTGTALVCMKVFPIKHMQLKVLRHVVMFIGRHVVNLEDYLFDKERLSLLDTWLRGDGLSDIPFPEARLPSVFRRREWALPPGTAHPKYLKLRVAIFSFLFFVTSSALFWIIPMAVMTPLLTVLPYSVPLLCVSANIIFFVFNPKMYFTAAAEFMLLCIIFVIGVLLQPLFFCASLRNISRLQLIQETMEYYHKLRRTVGVYNGEEGEAA
ncbi:Zn-finger protein, putative [Trypanosoma cruzi marinkellei]|uniref:Zn-finger protein, putative n=1 Tax=Trypanosoma cruzi marinkellei TaxID=85056 RepID=K2N4X7_TRYCR|nr:Zn-finger protein, putative [Trypanosoma cruzi marinkellei]